MAYLINFIILYILSTAYVAYNITHILVMEET